MIAYIFLAILLIIMLGNVKYIPKQKKKSFPWALAQKKNDIDSNVLNLRR